MTYSEWLEEMRKGQGTDLQKYKNTVAEAAKTCSQKTRLDMKIFLHDLDVLFANPQQKNSKPVSQPEYERITQNLGNMLAGLINRYQPPVDLLSQPQAAEALINILETIDGPDKKYRMPDFKRSTATNTAVTVDPSTYAAQMIAMDSIGEEASPREFINAIASIPRIKRTAAFKETINNPANKARLSMAKDKTSFMDEYNQTRSKIDSEDARTFKWLSDDLARRYRNDNIKYPQLEFSMKVLRTLAEAKQPNRAEWDNVMITPAEIEKTAFELRQEASRTVISDKTPQEYQDELADSTLMEYDLKAKCIHEIYNAKPVFREEFALDENVFVFEAYRKKDFDANMHEIDIKGYSFGGKPLTDDEFGSLSFLRVIDPKLSGKCLAVDGRTIEYENAGMPTAIAMLTASTIGYGDRTIEINGEKVQGPAERVGSTMRLAIAPARDKTEEALKAWNAGDKKPLGELIAAGLDHVLNDLDHYDKDGLRLNADHFTYTDMAKEAIGLLKRDDELMAAAKDAGLKQETITELEGIMMCNRIEKAGVEAKKRLTEAGIGVSSMSSFEREQCTLAMQRYDYMLKIISDGSAAFNQSEESQRVITEYNDALNAMDKKYGPPSSEGRKTMEAKIEIVTLMHENAYKMTHAMKRPEMFMTLGREGVKGLDKMLPQDRIDPKDAASMNPVELAQKLGLVKKRDIKTTAKDIYDKLTKEYKSGMINYTLYEARLKTMRELTGGNKNAKIDIETLDKAIEGKLKNSIGPLEKTIEAFTSKTYEGNMGRRLNNIYNTYGNDPRPDKAALEYPAYTKEEFSVLRKYTGEHLWVGKRAIRMKEFSALAVAVTQAYPEIGGVLLAEKKDGTGFENIITKPTRDDAAALRALYVSDVDQGFANHARTGIGNYFSAVSQPAREKVNEVLKAYNNGTGDPNELGKIIGLGIKNIVNNTMVVGAGASSVNISNTIEGHIVGQMAIIAEADPKVKDAVLKYASPDELAMAKGMSVLYGIERGAQEAREKLQASAKGDVTLSDIERKACVELLLRERLLTFIGNRHASKKLPPEMETKLLMEANEFKTGDSRANALGSLQIEAKLATAIGLPDFVKGLGIKGPLFARDLLDERMPNREEFMKLGDKEILDALGTRFGSEKDPFMNKEYTKEKYNADNQLEKSLREARIRETAPQQRTL